MQRVNRSAPAPKGVAFFLFLSLAVVPFSLRAAGVQVSFSPSFSAAADAWQQIADVFGSGYQPARAVTSPAPTDQGIEPLRDCDSSACPSREFACVHEVNELSAIVENASKVRVPQAGTTRRQCSRAASSRTSALPAAVEQSISAVPGTESLQTHVRALGTLRNVKWDAVTHGDAVRNDVLLKDVERHIVERSLAIPQSLRMLVRVKLPVIPSATKAAQCKVRAALDSARRIEFERAITSLSSTNPDNCEL